VNATALDPPAMAPVKWTTLLIVLTVAGRVENGEFVQPLTRLSGVPAAIAPVPQATPRAAIAAVLKIDCRISSILLGLI
jgi:hypothetical protein